MHKQMIWMVVASVMLATSVMAEQTNYASGNIGGSELMIGLGPRPVAMGEAFAAQANDVNSTAWNPAGLAQIQDHQLGFMHSLYLQETSLEYLAYAQKLFTGAGLGGYVTYLNFGSLDKYDEVNGLPVANGSFTPNVMTGALGYGQWLGSNLALGVTFKMISQTIDTEHYSAFAMDLGGLFKIGETGLQLGAVLQNFGSKLADAELPRNLKAGAGYTLQTAAKDRWTLVADMNLLLGDTSSMAINLGTEYWYQKFIAGRVGYQIKNNAASGSLAGLTAGLGVNVTWFTVDYALVSFGDLGLTHQLALTSNF